MRFRMLAVVLACLVAPWLVACPDTPERIDGQEVFSPNDPVLAQGPVFKQSRFQVYTLYRPQVQRRDFNGVFDIGPETARIVRGYWKERFSELTRPGHYGEFFLEFYDYMGSFAQTYPVDTRAKERMLDSLEKSFHAFCSVLGVEDAFVKFQKEQQRIHGN